MEKSKMDLAEKLEKGPGSSGQMPLQELQEQNKSLSVAELLHLLKSKVVSGRELPAQLKNPPWRVPASSHPAFANINAILSKSMEVQSSRVVFPEAKDARGDDFRDFILSNSSLAVSGLLQTYLSALGVEDVGVIFGVLLWDAAAREGPDDYEGTPHIWLNVSGHDIDNTHVFLPDSDAIEYFYKAKSGNAYRREDPLKTNLKLYLGQETPTEEGGSVRKDMLHNLRLFRNYTQGHQVEKFLVFNLCFCDLNPTVKMYHILMIDYIKETFPDVQLTDLEMKWSKICWTCFKNDQEKQDLKSCTECKIAKYCGKDCQKSDWKMHKLLHQELQRTKHILDNN